MLKSRSVPNTAQKAISGTHTTFVLLLLQMLRSKILYKKCNETSR
jgi:hypothetical protein